MNACCPAGESVDTCGLDTSALASVGIVATVVCQELRQEGDPSGGCPSSVPIDLAGSASLVVEGCCRPDGRCGLMLDALGGVLHPDLGCVASDAFSSSLVASQACGAGAGGAPASDAGP